jgi:hypothetical protein
MNLHGTIPWLEWPRLAVTYRLPFLAFFGPAFFEGAGFFLAVAEEEPRRLPPNAVSQPSAYLWFVPTRVIVTASAPLAPGFRHESAATPGRPQPEKDQQPLPTLINALRPTGQAADTYGSRTRVGRMTMGTPSHCKRRWSE